MNKILIATTFVIVGLLGTVSCKKAKSESYSVERIQSKENFTSQFTVPQSTPKLEQDAQQFDIPQWNPPSNWKAQPLGAMRKGCWIVSGQNNESAEITVLAFPGDVGGDLANTNRWAQQIGLAPMSLEEMDALSEFISIDGHESRFITLLNKAGERPLAIVVAMVPIGEGTWFFKCMGDASVVNAEKSNMHGFLKTVHF